MTTPIVLTNGRGRSRCPASRMPAGTTAGGTITGNSDRIRKGNSSEQTGALNANPTSISVTPIAVNTATVEIPASLRAMSRPASHSSALRGRPSCSSRLRVLRFSAPAPLARRRPARGRGRSFLRAGRPRRGRTRCRARCVSTRRTRRDGSNGSSPRGRVKGAGTGRA